MRDALLISVLGCLLCGCASTQLPEVDAEPVGTAASVQSRDGLSVAVEPIGDRHRLERWFRKDIVSEGLLPIRIVIENTHPSASFIVRREAILLRSADDAAESASSAGNVTNEGGGKSVLAAGALTLSPLLIGIGATLQGREQVTQYNLAEKQLATQTIPPGGGLQGFVYYKLPTNAPIASDYVVTLEATDLGTGRSLSFVLDVHLHQ